MTHAFLKALPALILIVLAALLYFGKIGVRID